MPPAEQILEAPVPAMAGEAGPVKAEESRPKMKSLDKLSLNEILRLDYRQIVAYDQLGSFKPSLANGRLFIGNMQAMRRLHAQKMAIRSQRVAAQFQLRKNRPGFTRDGVEECERRIAAIANKEAAVVGSYEAKRLELTQAIAMAVRRPEKRPYNAAATVLAKGYRNGFVLSGETVLTRHMTRNQKKAAQQLAADMNAGFEGHYSVGKVVVHNLDNNEVSAVELKGEDQVAGQEPRDPPPNLTPMSIGDGERWL